jgi:hypothetical protein
MNKTERALDLNLFIKLYNLILTNQCFKKKMFPEYGRSSGI